MEECSECEPEEMEPPVKKAKLWGARGVPESWATTPSVPWPGRGQLKVEGKLYHTEEDGELKYCMYDGTKRRPVCNCKPEGKCGLMATSTTRTTRPGFAVGCALREDRKERYLEAKEKNDDKLPDWKGGKAHEGKEDFVLHKDRECVTMPNNGQALPLCGCGVCFKPCHSMKREYAQGCIKNPGAKCECGAVAVRYGCCERCSKKHDLVAKRKKEREPELLACMEKHGIERAPDDPNDPSVKAKTPYAQQNRMADYAPRIVVRVSGGNRGFEWTTGCKHGIQFSQCTTCQTMEQMQNSTRYCSICTGWLSGNTYKSGTGICAECGKREGDYQRTEIRLRKEIAERVPFESSCLDDTMFGTDTKHCDVNKKRRPDNGWFHTDRAILLETDEDGGHCHQSYSAQCDATWMTDMATSIEGSMNQIGLNGSQVRVFVIRFNPDERDWYWPHIREAERLDAVCALVNKLRTLSAEELAAYDPLVPHVFYYYYHSKCHNKIEHARTSGGIIVHDVID